MKFKWLRILLVFGLFYVGFLQYKMVQYPHDSPPKNADFLIILGAKVNGTNPSLVLMDRINTAAHYMQKNKHTIAIASGGKGSGEDISEAVAIKRSLIKKGIAEKRIILEKKSTNTVENFSFSKKIIPDGAKIGLIVTNDFHMYRASSIARDQGLRLFCLPAKTPLIAIPKSYGHEYLAITKYYFLKIFH
ncbi:MAG: YdcF family protein [Bacillota bacterium]|nr:YdcF family protein [Bacillota bacterium]